jgi:kynurenine formamidase
MCDICVMNSVKSRMLSRRDFFRGSAAMAAGAGALAVAGPTPLRAQATGSGVVDMTHTLSADFPTYFGEPQFAAERVFSFDSDGFNLFNLTINEHTGTHIDAPLHFSADGSSVDEIAVEDLVAPLCVVDIAGKAADDPDAQVTPEDLMAWIEANGEIPDGACVAMHSGWAAKVATEEFRNFDGEAQHYPGFHVEAAQMLMEETGARSIAVDTLSLDHGISGDFATHYAWLPSGRFGIECLAGLDRLPASGATIIVGAPKHAGGSGGPARIFAMV